MLSLLALSSLAASTLEPSYTHYWELAPSYGQAASESGRFDSRNSVQGAYGYKLLSTSQGSLWVSLAGKELNGSLYQAQDTGLNVRDFQARSIGFGVAWDFSASQRWTFGLGLNNFWGQGTLKQTFSTPNLRQTLRFTEVKNREWQIDLHTRYSLHEDLALVGSVGLGQEQWSWNPSQSTFSGESVSFDKRLSLSDNPSTWQGAPVTGALRSQIREIKFGIRLLF